MAKVKALRDFQSAIVGGRSKNERFEYDMNRDPADLKKLGFVEEVGAPAAEEPKKK